MTCILISGIVYECSFCHRKFSTHSNLQRHKRKHTENSNELNIEQTNYKGINCNQGDGTLIALQMTQNDVQLDTDNPDITAVPNSRSQPVEKLQKIRHSIISDDINNQHETAKRNSDSSHVAEQGISPKPNLMKTTSIIF